MGHHPHSLSRAPLANIDQVQTKLEEHQLKVNLAKYFFGNTEVACLSFVLTPEGIWPGGEKLQLLRDMPPPDNLRQVRQFIGLCPFFCNHI